VEHAIINMTGDAIGAPNVMHSTCERVVQFTWGYDSNSEINESTSLPIAAIGQSQLQATP
jgi:hypothetical protein